MHAATVTRIESLSTRGPYTRAADELKHNSRAIHIALRTHYEGNQRQGAKWSHAGWGDFDGRTGTDCPQRSADCPLDTPCGPVES